MRAVPNGRYRIAFCTALPGGLYLRTDTSDQRPVGASKQQTWHSGVVPWEHVEGDHVGDILVIDGPTTYALRRSSDDWDGPAELN